ncbi:hypothetical protein ACJMK2_000415 [Sinanodonta woodiana]|uniref:Uncharacterized protein n=1 Tax=Sinanodonta woodiana TaxID=1069815 RepID=A0ABD3XP66_SINWO
MDYTASMSGKSISFAILQILLFHALRIVAGEYCPYRNCDGSCCGNDYNSDIDVCCEAILLFLSVFAGVCVLALLIGLFVCCHHTPRSVIRPKNTANQTIVLNNTGVAHGTPSKPGLPHRYAGFPHGVAPPKDVTYVNLPEGSSIYSTIDI